MTADFDSDLERILDTYDAKKAAIEEASQRRKMRHEEFLEEFDRIADSVVRPVFEDAGKKLKTRGHDYAVKRTCEQSGGDGKREPARIELEVYLNGRRPSSLGMSPGISVTLLAGTTDESVWVHESTMTPSGGGMSGSGGAYTLDQVTSDVIQGHVVKVLNSSLGK